MDMWVVLFFILYNRRSPVYPIMISLLKRLNRVLLGSELFSCIGFEPYVEWAIIYTYKDVIYVPETEGADQMSYVDIVNRFYELGPEVKARTVEKYKALAKRFDLWENGGLYEAQFAREVVGLMYNECQLFIQNNQCSKADQLVVE